MSSACQQQQSLVSVLRGPAPWNFYAALGAELRAAGRPSEARKWDVETSERDKRKHAYRFFFGDAATRLGHEMPLRLGRRRILTLAAVAAEGGRPRADVWHRRR